jgi:uncharacterized protein YcbK (DUF882 family)
MRAVVLFTAVVATLGAQPAQAADHRRVWLYNIHLRERLTIAPFRDHGLLQPIAWCRINRFFRDRKTGQRHTVNPRLVRVLAYVQRSLGARRIELVSGYREPPEPTRLTSFHQVGHASDVILPAVSHGSVFHFCRARLPHAGCGWYPGRFVHIDVRSRAAVWVDRHRSGAAERDPFEALGDAR